MTTRTSIFAASLLVAASSVLGCGPEAEEELTATSVDAIAPADPFRLILGTIDPAGGPGPGGLTPVATEFWVLMRNGVIIARGFGPPPPQLLAMAQAGAAVTPEAIAAATGTTVTAAAAAAVAAVVLVAAVGALSIDCYANDGCLGEYIANNGGWAQTVEAIIYGTDQAGDSRSWTQAEQMGATCAGQTGGEDNVRHQGSTYVTYTPGYENCRDCCFAHLEGDQKHDPGAMGRCISSCVLGSNFECRGG